MTHDIAHFSSPLYLQSGRILEPYDLAYATYGELNEDKSNAILVCHALTGSQFCAEGGESFGESGESKSAQTTAAFSESCESAPKNHGESAPNLRASRESSEKSAASLNSKKGWWSALVGENKPIDTKKYFVICVNTLGSVFGSTSPLSKSYPDLEPYRLRFPVLTIFDMVKAQRILLSALQIPRLCAVIGGSMGGMQALAFATTYPTIARHFIALSATHATSPQVIAFNKLMTEAILNDPSFEKGNYDLFYKPILGGLKVARMAGFLHYISKETMERKFSRRYVRDDGLFELFGRFEIERYLEYNAANFAANFDALCYLYLLKAISIFDLSYGCGDLCEALGAVKNKLHLISFSGDSMFYPHEMREIRTAMEKIGRGDLCEFYEIKSDYGHDSFLVECDRFADLIDKILKE